MVTNEEKQELLSKIDFKREYERIGVVFDQSTPGPDGWLQCHAIDRPDHSPSAAINIQNGFYTDLGSGQRFDFFEMMQMAGGYKGFLDVVNHYRQQLGITPPPKKRGPKPKSPETEVDLMKWDGSGDRWCGLKSTNRSAVERAGGVLCRYKDRYNCVAFRVFSNPESSDAAPSGYVVMQTDGSELPSFNGSGQQVGSVKCKVVAGTTSGLIGTEALLTIQRAREEGRLDELTLFKVEGITDMTALLARIPAEKRGKWLVITNSCGASEKPKRSWLPVFTGVNTVVIHDCDKPGQDGAAAWCSFLKDKASRVRNVVLPYEITPNHGRDLKDFLTEHSFQEFEELVEGTPDADCEKTTAKEKAENNPNRIATEYLRRNRTLEGHPSIYTLIFQQGIFYSWTAGGFEIMPLELLQAELTTFCNTLFYEDYMKEYEEWEARTDDTPEPLVRNVTTRLIADVLNELRAQVITKRAEECFWRTEDCPPEFRNPKDLIPVENGYIYLKRLEEGNLDCLLPHTPLYFNRTVLPVRFDPTATAQPWYDLVEQSLIEDPNNIAKHNILQEYMGYCLVPDTTLQKFLLMVGDGANGKSAILTGFSTVLGIRNISNVSLEMFSDKFALGQLRGKLVNIVDDLSETDKICEGKLKSVVAGMPINTDRKNKEAINFTPTTRLIFACNTLPKFQDKTNGIQRRLILLSFNHTVSETEKRKEFSLPEFWEQYKSGILNWLLEGLLRLRRNGYELTRSEEAEKETQEYIYELNPAATFIAENLVADPDRFIVCSVLYKSYTDWCYKNGMNPLNSNNFGRELRRKMNVTKAKRMTRPTQREYAYIGVRFADYQGEYYDFH